MKRTKTLCCTFLAVAMLGGSGIAASASAAKVPGFLLLPNDSGTLTFSGAIATTVEIQGTTSIITGHGVALKIALTPGFDDEGTYIIDFENVTNPHGESCSTSGDAAGTVLVPSNKVRTVHDVTSTTGNGMLFEVSPEYGIICGTETIHVKETVLTLFEGTGTKEGNDFNTWAISAQCKGTSGGIPFENAFWGLSGIEELAKLNLNFGAGFHQGCYLFGGTSTKIELKSNKMAELMEVG